MNELDDLIPEWLTLPDVARILDIEVSKVRRLIDDGELVSVRRGDPVVRSVPADLLVEDGFYGNRADFIRTAIRNQIDRHADVVRQSVARRTLDLGLRHYSRAELEAARAAGRQVDIKVLGLARIAPEATEKNRLLAFTLRE